MKLTPGDLIELEFIDHCIASGVTLPDGIPIRLPCYYISETKNAYMVSTWTAFEDLTNHNNDVYSIIKHKSLKIKKLRGPWKPKKLI